MNQRRITGFLARATTWSLLAATLVVPLSPPSSVSANTAIVVDPSGATCTIDDAVRAANAQATVGACANPSGVEIIEVSTLIDIRHDALHGPSNVGGAPTALPEITAKLTIRGTSPTAGFRAIDPLIVGPGYRGFRLATVASGGSLTLEDVTIDDFDVSGRGGLTFGGESVEGGAIRSLGPVTLDGVVMSDNSASGGNGAGQLGATGSKNGGSARGGAIYATGPVTLTDSVFLRNSVAGGLADTVDTTSIGCGSVLSCIDFDGGSGGSAIGADVMVDATNGALTATRTIFEGSRATARDGRHGFVPQSVKDGVRAEPHAANGRTGPRDPEDGADGFCDGTPNLTEATGFDGLDGRDGRPAGNGGDGGDATGAIFAGNTIVLTSSAIVDVRATAGGSGSSGIPELGGFGGDAGDGVTCSETIGTTIKVYDGDAGIPGSGGDNGAPAAPGDQGEAVATLRAPTIRLVNTTITDVHAEVRDDDVDGTISLSTRIQRLNEAFGLAALSGANGKDADGNVRTDHGVPNSGSTTNKSTWDTLQTSIDVGFAQIIGEAGAGDSINVSFSTLVDGSTTVPSSNAHAEPSVIALAKFAIANAVLQDLATGGCPLGTSDGYSVWHSATCIASPQTGDFVSPNDVLVPTIQRSGAVITTDAFGTSYRMATRPPIGPFGSNLAPAVDRQPAPCQDDLKAAVTLDARGGTRDAQCDSGAHELREVFANIAVSAFDSATDPVARPLTGNGTQVSITRVLRDDTVPFPDLVDVNAALEISLPGFVGLVDYGDGNGPVAETTKEFDLPVTQTGFLPPMVLTLYPTAESGTVTVEARLFTGVTDPIVGSVTSASRSGTLVFDPTVDITHTGPGDILRCSTGNTFSFTATPTGGSRVDATPDALAYFPETGWSIPAFDAVGESSTVVIPIDPTAVNAGSQIVPFVNLQGLNGAGSDIRNSSNDGTPFERVNVLPDTTMAVSVTGLDGIEVGETRTATYTVSNLGTVPCNDVVGVTTSATFSHTPDTIATTVLGSLDAGDSVGFTFPFTAPDTAGTVTITPTIDMSGNDRRVAPISVSSIEIPIAEEPPPSSSTTTTVPTDDPPDDETPDGPGDPSDPGPDTGTTTTTTMPGADPPSDSVPPIYFPPPGTDEQPGSDGILAAESILQIRVPEAAGGKTVFGNLTATRTSTVGFATAYACEDGPPLDETGRYTKSDLNFNGAVLSTTSNRLVATADDNGDVCFYSSAPAALIVDINATAADAVTPIDNQRTDTRQGAGILPADEILRINVPEAVGGKTVFGNLTATRTSTVGFATAFACEDGPPLDETGRYTKSDLNFNGAVLSTTSNRLIATTDTNGDICIYTSAPAALVVDINATADTDAIVPIDNQRTDTREGTGILPADEVLTVKIPGAAGGTTVIGNLTATRTSTVGFATAFACEDGPPLDETGRYTKSDLNFNGAVLSTTSNRLIATTDTNGDICIYTSAPAALVVDINATADDAITPLPNQRTDTRFITFS